MSDKSSKISKETLKKLAFGASILAIFAGYYYYSTQQQSKNKKQNNNSCCGGSNSCESKENTNIKNIVNERYSNTARNFTKSQQNNANNLAKVFGYTDDQLKEFGSDANMGLGCGNPVANASLKPGEIVMDLGSGGGFDSFLALKKVGNKGRVIGIDMSSDMIQRATKNAIKRGYKVVNINDIDDDNANIAFYNTEIENMELINDNYVNCCISNCVLNLVPNKLKAFKEIYRVLKDNNQGRLAISDIAMKKPFPNDLNNDIRAYIAGYVNCISGACLVSEYERLLKEAGFKQVKLVEKKVDLNVWKSGWESGGASGGCCGTKEESCCGGVENNDNQKNENTDGNNCCGDNDNDDKAKIGLEFSKEEQERIKKSLKNIDLNDYIGSYYIFALK